MPNKYDTLTQCRNGPYVGPTSTLGDININLPYMLTCLVNLYVPKSGLKLNLFFCSLIISELRITLLVYNVLYIIFSSKLILHMSYCVFLFYTAYISTMRVITTTLTYPMQLSDNIRLALTLRLRNAFSSWNKIYPSLCVQEDCQDVQVTLTAISTTKLRAEIVLTSTQ